MSWKVGSSTSGLEKSVGSKLRKRREVSCGTRIEDLSKIRVSSYRRIRGRDFHPESTKVVSREGAK
jgi:hypothetical protein